MKRCFTLLHLILLPGISLYAQRYNESRSFLTANRYWPVGNMIALDFGPGVPQISGSSVPYTPVSREAEGLAAVCDPQTGNLLFYSDGVQVWNRAHQRMPNGDSLLGQGSQWVNTRPFKNVSGSLNGTCIVPMPYNPDKYYLLSAQQNGYTVPIGSTNHAGSLFYNVVDMSLDGGRGDIVPGSKNIALSQNGLCEFILAIPGRCGDVWVITHRAGGLVLEARRITRDSIAAEPVLSDYSHLSPVFRTPHFIAGAAASPDGRFVSVNFPAPIGSMVTKESSVLFRFDASSGRFSDPLVIGTTNGKGEPGAAAAFSPDGRRLYREEIIRGPGTDTIVLFQYDISGYDSAAIQQSKTRIGSMEMIYNDYNSMRLYDGMIYYAQMRSRHIARISQPNLAGTACGFDPAAFTFLSDAVTRLATEVVLPFYPDTLHQLTLDTLICEGWASGISLAIRENEPPYAFMWQDGSAADSLLIHEAGTYWVQGERLCMYRSDTFHVRGNDIIRPRITINEFRMGTQDFYQEYQWLLNGDTIRGATGRFHDIAANGFYQVSVHDETGCSSVSEAYEVNNAKFITGPPGTEPGIAIYPNPVSERIFLKPAVAADMELYGSDGRQVARAYQSTSLYTAHLPAGAYILKVNRSGHVPLFFKIQKAPR